MKTDTEIRESYVSSAGGAVAGAVLFGPLGAMVGGRVKKKKDKTITMYLIFTYQKNDTIDWISFDVTADYLKARKIRDGFRSRTNKEQVSIEL